MASPKKIERSSKVIPLLVRRSTDGLAMLGGLISGSHEQTGNTIDRKIRLLPRVIIMTQSNLRLYNSAELVILFVFIAMSILPSQVLSQDHEETKDEYSDKVYLKNGDRVSGNIKDLDRGKLRIKTTTMDTVYVATDLRLREEKH